MRERKLAWPIDELARKVASKWNPLARFKKPIPQDSGNGRFNRSTWRRWMEDVDDFPGFAIDTCDDSLIVPSPSNIIRAYSNGLLLPATVLVFCWGGMKRAKNFLLRPGIPRIKKTLSDAVISIRSTGSIELAWQGFYSLNWSQVAPSKCLHFLARGLGFDANPPVPIDNAVVLNDLWPKFRERSRMLNVDLECSWVSRDWGSYCSYMTVILTWAESKNWTTTQIENTLFGRRTGEGSK